MYVFLMRKLDYPASLLDTNIKTHPLEHCASKGMVCAMLFHRFNNALCGFFDD